LSGIFEFKISLPVSSASNILFPEGSLKSIDADNNGGTGSTLSEKVVSSAKTKKFRIIKNKIKNTVFFIASSPFFLILPLRRLLFKLFTTKSPITVIYFQFS
jgi:hypothetical protein